MKKRNIGKEILQGLKEISAYRKGKIELKTHQMDLPTAEDVPNIRKRLGLSQQSFASFMGVSVGTIRNWEQKRREPHGSARSLLLIADKQPQTFKKVFSELR